MNDEELKRKGDFERLIRIDENVDAIKKTLERYPLPVIVERLDEQEKKLSIIDGKIDKHADRHWLFWLSTAAPVVAGVILLWFGK